jgi:hypothetical protein
VAEDLDGDGHIDVAVSDVDKDGHLDLVVLESQFGLGQDGSITVFLNDGLGTMVLHSSLASRATGPVAFVLGDLDSDGDIDIAVADFVSSDIAVIKNQGDAFFGSRAQSGSETLSSRLRSPPATSMTMGTSIGCRFS